MQIWQAFGVMSSVALVVESSSTWHRCQRLHDSYRHIVVVAVSLASNPHEGSGMIPAQSYGVTSAKYRSNAERRNVNREVPIFLNKDDPSFVARYELQGSVGGKKSDGKKVGHLLTFWCLGAVGRRHRASSLEVMFNLVLHHRSDYWYTRCNTCIRQRCDT